MSVTMPTIGMLSYERLADAGQGVGQTRSGHDGEDTDGTGGPRGGVGHDAGRSLVGDEQVGHALALKASQSSLFWAPGTPKTQGTPSQQQGRGGGLGPVILPCTPSRRVKRPSSTWPACTLSQGTDGHGRAQNAAAGKQFPAVQLG